MDRDDGAHGHLLSRAATGATGRTSRRDRELEAGALAHFQDAAYYQTAYGGRTDDVAYYTRIAARHDAVLEYGIGNGRVAIPIARKGTEVVGVDHARPMLADLRARLAQEPDEVRRRVTGRIGDMRRARLGRRFSLIICPFNAVLHLYTRVDVERWLARVTEHLAPGGELVFDVSMPIDDDLARDPHTPYRAPPLVHPSAGRVKYREYFDYDRVRQILFVSMFFTPTGPGASGEEFMTPLAHRQFFPQELEALLHYNGFAIRTIRGDFEGGPLTRESDTMIWHVRRAKARARGRGKPVKRTPSP